MSAVAGQGDASGGAPPEDAAEGTAPDSGGAAAPAAAEPGPPQVPMLPGAGPQHRYLGRFAFVYLALGVTLVAAVAGVVILALQPGPPKPARWSAWRPTTHNTAKATQQIADFVAPQYRLGAKGSQLVAVLPSAPELTRYQKVSSVSTIAIRASASSQSYRIVLGSAAYQDQLCGLGNLCAIRTGTPSDTRQRLLRREALEIALYTFKYLPQIDALIAYMPPPPGQQPSTVLFFERSDFKTELSQPLSKTLPLATPPLPGETDKTEASRIDKLTLPLQFTYGYQAFSDGTVALILTPGAA